MSAGKDSIPGRKAAGQAAPNKLIHATLMTVLHQDRTLCRRVSTRRGRDDRIACMRRYPPLPQVIGLAARETALALSRKGALVPEST